MPLETGMVIEEPDIEIGAGVSSKGELLSSTFLMLSNVFAAISRRVPPDAGRRGGHHGGRGGFDHGPGRFRKHEKGQQGPRHNSPRPEQGVAVPPAVPGFGFQLPGFN